MVGSVDVRPVRLGMVVQGSARLGVGRLAAPKAWAVAASWDGWARLATQGKG